MPFFERAVESVDPFINQMSSSTIPRRNVRFVVKSGNVESARENRNEGGAKIDIVPVPVRSARTSPVSRTFLMRLRYWYSSWSYAEGDMGIVAVATR